MVPLVFRKPLSWPPSATKSSLFSWFAYFLTILAVCVVFRSAVGLHGYSGQGTPPMFGDFEAQRHFVELVWNLPVSQWYRYDPAYWGLDYPPLTAYHSWLIGWIAQYFNPEWVQLDSSRGFESATLKLFMRYTALVSDLVVYCSACFAFYFLLLTVGLNGKGVRKSGSTTEMSVLWVLLMQPALMIIDHGHFQYNSIMLGLTLWSVIALARKHYLVSACLFCLAVGFKHMALFYSLAYFSFLLGVAYRRDIQSGVLLVMQLGLVVLGTFGLLLLPFLYNSLDDALQVMRRLFPFERGLYEDKVANVWCALNVVVKLRQLFSLPVLIRLSTICTLLANLIPSLGLFKARTVRDFLYGLTACSLAFFLFGFQVHEKSILIPLLPALLLFGEEPAVVDWFMNAAMFSMVPLLIKDKLLIAYVGLMLGWNLLTMGASIRQTKGFVRSLVQASYLAMLLVHVSEAIFAPPQRLPDLFTVLNVLISASIFFCIYLYFTFRILVSTGILGSTWTHFDHEDVRKKSTKKNS